MTTRVSRPSHRPIHAPEIVDRRSPSLWVIVRYSLMLVLSELSSTFVGVLPGALLDAGLVPVMLAHFVLRPDTPHRRMLPALALVALLRTLSVAAVVPRLPEYTWYALIGVPVLIGAFLTIGLADEPAERLGLTVWRPWLDGFLAILGLPVGFLGYVLLRPQALVTTESLVPVLAALAILAVFGGFLEELVYRGVLQTVAIDAFGSQRAGILFSATLSGAMYWGSGSIPFMVGMWLLGMGYGFALARGASLWGIAASHTVMLWGMGLLWPVLLR